MSVQNEIYYWNMENKFYDNPKYVFALDCLFHLSMSRVLKDKLSLLSV